MAELPDSPENDQDPIISSTDPLGLARLVLMAQNNPVLYGPKVHERIASGACTRRLAAALLDQTDRRARAEGDNRDLLRLWNEHDALRNLWADDADALVAELGEQIDARMRAEEQLEVAMRFAEHDPAPETWQVHEGLGVSGQPAVYPPSGWVQLPDEPLVLPGGVTSGDTWLGPGVPPGAELLQCARVERHVPHPQTLPGTDPQGWCDGAGLVGRELADVDPEPAGLRFPPEPVPELPVDDEPWPDVDLSGVALTCLSCLHPLGDGVFQFGAMCSRCEQYVVVRSPTGLVTLFDNPAWPASGVAKKMPSTVGELRPGCSRYWAAGYWRQDEVDLGAVKVPWFRRFTRKQD